MRTLSLLIALSFALTACTQEPTPLTPQSIADRWAADGLEVEQITPLPSGEIPPGATGGLSFIAPNNCNGDCGGKIIHFTDPQAAQALADVWRAMNQHIYLSTAPDRIAGGGTILIQINNAIDPATADQYGAILQ